VVSERFGEIFRLRRAGAGEWKIRLPADRQSSR
jgi:hypothetical protein